MQKKVAIFCCISPYFSTEQERLFVNHKFFVPFHKKKLTKFLSMTILPKKKKKKKKKRIFPSFFIKN